jgi:hypothetical protein
MSKAYGWNHPIDESDQWDGFNEPGIEHFSGSPIPHLAREVNQNSFDSGRGGTVRVVIKHRMVDTAQLPNLDELKATIALCGKASAEESAKARQFFELAASELGKPKLSVLEISDFNTKGMSGPSKNGTPFYAFMKAKGQSKKASDTATGSFGIGKFAPYAVSRLRTVFVSTVYVDQESKFQRLTQGKSILMSHDDDTCRRQGVGFWGIKERCQPVFGSHEDIPNWILRGGKELTEEDVGTKLVILGFDHSTGWQENLATSVAENFFGSIAEGNLEVDIDGKYLLSKTNIKNFFLDESLIASISGQKNEPEQFRNANSYLQCLTDHEGVITEQSQTVSLGLCQLKIVIAEGLPKRVCVLRNGMFISDSLSLPGLKNFADFKEFVAVFECKNSKGIELLRAMEPPRHDDFEAERLPSKEEQLKGRKALKEMATWIRDMLKRHAKDPVSDVTTLDELKDFFPDDSGEGNGKPAEEINPFGLVVIRARPVPLRLNRPTLTEPEGPGPGAGMAGGEGGGGSDGAGGGDSESGGQGTAPGGQGASMNRPGIALSNLRAVSTSGKSRRILFTPMQSGLIAVSLYEAGADSDYDIGIKECDRGEIKNGRVILEVEAGVRTSLEIVLKSSFEGALKVVAHEI